MTDENWIKKLAKSQDDKWMGGVCGGLGNILLSSPGKEFKARVNG